LVTFGSDLKEGTVMDRDDGRPLNVLDAELARLRERFPAWRV
jgi:hypothetical protein